MDENRLLEFSKPVMPEEYDRVEPPGLAPLRAFGAGLIDPYGIPSWLAEKLGLGGRPGMPEYARRRLQELKSESPRAAGMGAAIPTALVGGTLAGGTLREVLNPNLLLPAIGVGASVAPIAEDFGAYKRSPRAQGSYPPSGAY